MSGFAVGAGSGQSAAIHHTLQRHTEILQDYRQVFSMTAYNMITMTIDHDHDDHHDHQQAGVQQDRRQHRGHRGERGPAQLGAIGHLRLQEQAERGHGKLAEGDGAHKKL